MRLFFFVILLLVILTKESMSQEIFMAIGKADTVKIDSILSVNPNSLSEVLENAYTPLSFASMIGKIDVVEILLSHGAIINHKYDNIRTALFNAVYKGHTDIVKILVDKGADINESTLGLSLLHVAAMRNHTDIAEFLIESGMDTNKQDTYGLTPIHLASELGHIEMCKLLLSNGANARIRDKNNGTPYHLATEANQNMIIDCLPDIDAKDLSRNFPVNKGSYMGSHYNQGLERMPINDVMRIIGPHSGIAISKDGKDIFWVRGDYSGKIWHMEEENGKWTIPEIVHFSDQYDYSYPGFSIDGSKLFFTSDRPKNDSSLWYKGKGDIWYIEKTNNSWSDPINLGDSINTANDEFISSTDMYNNIYFTRVTFSNGKVLSDIYFSKFQDGAYQKAIPLDTTINSPEFEVGPFISPDGTFILFGSQRYGDMTTYISYKDDENNWTNAVKIQDVFSPFKASYVQGISCDGKYILFAGEKKKQWDIYWISTDCLR